MTRDPARPYAKPSSRQWTEAQRQAIGITGRNLLISAAAGSGKTAVLSERCAQLVCRESDPCDVTGLLVVTFTEAAAAEMKGRIGQAIRARLAGAESPRLLRQLALLDQMQASTLHSFCATLIRRHFHLLGLDPGFRVLDGDEALLLRAEMARDLFEQRYDDDPPSGFGQFINAYGDGHDAPLVDLVVRTHEILGSVVDPDQWRKQAMDRLEQAAALPLHESEIGRSLLAMIKKHLAALAWQAEEAHKVLVADGSFARYADYMADIFTDIKSWIGMLGSGGLDAVVPAFTAHEFARLPSASKDTPGKDAAKQRVDDVRDRITKGPLAGLLRFSAGEWQDGLKAIVPHAHTFLGLVEQLEQLYAREKSRLRALDFNDLERFALRLLRDADRPGLTPSPLARQLHRQYQHVLVDEYQDINPVQDAILALVSHDCLLGEPATKRPRGLAGNLFCVGDVKQSIYRFRLAEPARFLEREHTYRKSPGDATGEVIDLQANFRSRAPLLETINSLFRLLMVGGDTEIEYDKAQELRPGLVFPADDRGGLFTGAPVELHLLPSKVGQHAAAHAAEEEPDDDGSGEEADRTEREAMVVARRIRELMGRDGGRRMSVTEHRDGEPCPRPIRFGDIAVLLRSMKHKAKQFAQVLRQNGIPVHCKSGSGLFQAMEIRDLLALLSVLDNQQQDVPLAAVLRGPLANLAEPDDCLARIRLCYRGSRDRPVAYHQAVVLYAKEQHDELAARLREVLADLARWRELAQRRPLAELIWHVYDATGYLAFCAGLDDGAQRVANLIHLHDRARQFGSFQRQGLGRFLAFLAQLEEESEQGQPAIAGESEDVVRIMSVHASKGLEFPVVFIPDLGKRFNLDDTRGGILVDRTMGLGLLTVDQEKRVRYASAAWALVADGRLRQTLAEEMRILYVAMTRAREHVVLVGTARSGGQEKWQALWADHRGPLPPSHTLAANTMLDWVGPAWAALRHSGKEPIRVTSYPAEEVVTWKPPKFERHALNERQQAMAKLEKLDRSPPLDEQVSRIVSRVTHPYIYQAYSGVEAARSVTQIAKPAHATPAGTAGSGTDDVVSFERRLATPRSLAADLKPSPLDIGSATHLVLQYLDFAHASDAALVQSQIDSLAERHLITQAMRSIVDVSSILWFVQTELGQRVRSAGTAVLREVPANFPMSPGLGVENAPPSDDPLDQIMVRSRVDLLVPAADGSGWEVVDYKTDNVTSQTIDERAAVYKGQVDLYRVGLGRILGKPITATHLVFLRPQIIVSA
jgi:ATP-dependent helicase/nuclease subunit A